MRARLQVRRAAEAQDGFTLVELLVVIAIIGVVLAGITQLFMSAMKSQNDQTNRTQAQQDARLGLDKLRREIRCASGLTTPSGYPASAITITLGSYCPTAGGAAATVTWCTKDKNGASPPVAGAQPYTLWRYTGSACSGTGTKWASNLVDKVDAPSITAGKIFGAASVPAATLTPATTRRDIARGDLLLRRHGGARRAGRGSGDGRVAHDRLRADQQDHGQLVGVHGSELVQRVRPGRRRPAPAEERHRRHLVRRHRADPLTGNPLTLPSATITVADTSNFNSGANTIAFGASGAVTCTGTTSTSFTGCTGGQAGQYPKGMPVYNASSARPPRATLSVSLPFDLTPANTNQRFVLIDNIVLRNSQPF